MRTMVIVNHPYEGSFCHALADAAAQGARRAGRDVDLLDLDASGFDPVMRRADLAAWREHTTIDPVVADLQRRIDAADHLVLVHPVWWETAPAVMKGFIDKVLVPGWAYEDGAFGLPRGRFVRLQRVTVATTMATPGPAYRWLFGNTAQKASVRGVWQKMGVPARWLSHPRVAEVSPQRRERWLARMEDRVAGVRLAPRDEALVPVG
ncbi:NAD(P)H-dependent oxidoreductase [Cellulomonas humilata]|uniref:NADPH-quinone reductase n=1 Tax=Cellulomonas humilata TaxID=144055 RepID=A0ABU0EDJ5_9CELL|nr:NAD(P)H-dependent oxidoreductase [Cellulomonas humilata]MDQ0373332.1 putative NADPH-quinone reductase [Cellulomonas humilata]